jgi:hypothetical protein
MKNLLRLYRWKYTFFAGTFFFFIAWIFFIDGNNVFALFDLWKEKKSYQEGITFYEEQLKQIKVEKAEVLGNDDAAEKFAREKYRMKKEGETVFIIVDSDGKMLD